MTEYQSQMLMKRFQANPYLNGEEKRQLAKSLNVSGTKIRNWFDYQRKKLKAKNMLCEGESVFGNVH